ncbi:polysaccharide biosynthesis protein [Candidatus Peribacteria bacterium]|nr:MAG: polysaccharide biosynthesis protein [Candidatus Peribacteria bacterium]
MDSYFSQKTVLITGATGSIGSEILRSLLPHHPRSIRVFSRDEHKQLLLKQEMAGRAEVEYVLGDVRNLDSLQRAMEGVDIVFHCAAYKHISFCEANVLEAVQANILGTQNVIDAAVRAGVQKVLFISTDKAAAPQSAMGATKFLAERLIGSAGYSPLHRTLCASVRFGNMFQSRGSVVPLLSDQMARGVPLTISDPAMTRFTLPIPDAVERVLQAVKEMQGGEVFILKMPVMLLGDLVDVLIEERAPLLGKRPADIQRVITGPTWGERLHETLMTEDEARFASETDTMFIVRTPSVRTLPSSFGIPLRPDAIRQYSSAEGPFLSREEIRSLLRNTPVSRPSYAMSEGQGIASRRTLPV